MESYYYLLINLSCLLIPFLFSFYKKHPFYKQWKFFFPANILIALFFIIWDIYFVSIKVWGFNPSYLIGIYVYNLPIEEILFFICIPYACVFTHFAVLIGLKNNTHFYFEKYITYTLIIILLFLGLLFYKLQYTSTIFILTSLYLIGSKIVKLNLFPIYITFLLIIPFFIVSNGILTGSFIKEPIVWYNNAENLGIIFITLPIEDFVYAFLLIASNISLSQYFQKIIIK